MASESLGPGSNHKGKLTALVVAMIAVTSFSLVYLFTDVFNKDSPQATIQVYSIDFPEDVQYEIYLNRTGEMIAHGILPSNESVIHHFKGFVSEQIVFRHSGWSERDWISPLLLSDGQRLAISVFPEGGVGWSLGY